MATYLPQRDSNGRFIHLHSTVRYEPHAAPGPARVGTVVALGDGKVTVRSPITEEAVLDASNQPTGKYRALTQPTFQEEELLATDVTLWG